MTVANTDLDTTDAGTTKRGWPASAAVTLVGFIVFWIGQGFWNDAIDSGASLFYADPADLAANVEIMGSSYRSAHLGQFLVLCGYVMFVVGVGLLFRRFSGLHRLRQLSLVTSGLVFTSGFVDVLGTTGRLLSVGTVDLDNPGPTEVVSPPNFLVQSSNLLLDIRGILWMLSLLLSFVTIVAAVIIKIVRWRANRI